LETEVPSTRILGEHLRSQLDGGVSAITSSVPYRVAGCGSFASPFAAHPETEEIAAVGRRVDRERRLRSTLGVGCSSLSYTKARGR